MNSYWSTFQKPGDTQYRPQHEVELSAYQNFRRTQANNPCFQTLPWKNADALGDQARFYPYAERAQNRDSNGQFNYSQRTNARFTDVYSHLMSKRLSRIIQDSPNYERIKYFIALEEAGCYTSEDEANLRRLLPNLSIDRSVRFPSPMNSEYSVERNAPVLYNYGKSIGLKPADWTMEFKEENDPNYNAVMFYGRGQGDAKIFNVTGGNVLSEIGSTDPAVRPLLARTQARGITDFFGERFSCIDDLGSPIHPNSKGDNQLCSALRAGVQNVIKSMNPQTANCENCVVRSPASVVENLAQTAQTTLTRFTQAQIDRGRRLVEDSGKGKCVSCHSGDSLMLPPEYQFVPGQTDAQRNEAMAVLRSKSPDFFRSLERRILVDKNMPPAPDGRDLTDEERRSILAYILSLANRPQ